MATRLTTEQQAERIGIKISALRKVAEDLQGELETLQKPAQPVRQNRKKERIASVARFYLKRGI